jgi:hypothetical protein
MHSPRATEGQKGRLDVAFRISFAAPTQTSAQHVWRYGILFVDEARERTGLEPGEVLSEAIKRRA